MNKYNWRINSASGEVEALNITDAMCKAIQRYAAIMPYFDTDESIARVDVLIKKLHD